eukprot:13175887-Heterocapsa_arctica.AAC.1
MNNCLTEFVREQDRQPGGWSSTTTPTSPMRCSTQRSTRSWCSSQKFEQGDHRVAAWVRQKENNIEPETSLAIPCSKMNEKASVKSSKETAQMGYDGLKIHSKVDEEFETQDIEHTTAKEQVKAFDMFFEAR